MSELFALESSPRGRGGARPGAGRPKEPGSRRSMQGGASRTDGRWHVYVIHEVDMPEICKIGIAGNVMARLGNLQTGTWRRLKIAAVFLVGDQQFATAVERQTHSALAGVHELGEWFKVRPERAVREIEAVCGSLGIPFEHFQRQAA